MSDTKTTKIAIVTGSNKGIGFAIVKGLCKKFNGTVYLTSRNTEKGEAAVKKLKDLGYNPSFHQLDVDDETSVNTFRDYIKNTHGGIDLLINNAGIGQLNETPSNILQYADRTLKTNYFGLLRVCDAFFPLLRENSRVINMSSSAGHLNRLPSADLRSKFSNSTLTVSELTVLVREFLTAVKNGTYRADGWGERSYSTSKIAVSALTRIQQRYFDKDKSELNVSVNSVHPGYVITDLNPGGDWTPDQGAKATLFLALEAENLKGQYVWKDCRIVDWLAPNTPERH